MSEFTHLDQNTRHPRMVDISAKQVTHRTAVAEAQVFLGEELFNLLQETGATSKGPVIQTAVIAGIQGAKRTSELIPMCHPLSLSNASVDITLNNLRAVIQVTVKTTGPTGVEMEALTGASVAALTLYDMCKSVSKRIVIESIRLLEKTGGKSGDFKWNELQETHHESR
ncbi:MAG: cyclic pyranopterin monophosphate synthase MoaC [SAR324 cluster bacterium]|nr:cyclic pyranopterin monophosphate synthase MoaC [SAR324 cluster bacterium]